MLPTLLELSCTSLWLTQTMSGNKQCWDVLRFLCPDFQRHKTVLNLYVILLHCHWHLSEELVCSSNRRRSWYWSHPYPWSTIFRHHSNGCHTWPCSRWWSTKQPSSRWRTCWIHSCSHCWSLPNPKEAPTATWSFSIPPLWFAKNLSAFGQYVIFPLKRINLVFRRKLWCRL